MQMRLVTGAVTVYYTISTPFVNSPYCMKYTEPASAGTFRRMHSPGPAAAFRSLPQIDLCRIPAGHMQAAAYPRRVQSVLYSIFHIQVSG